MAKNLSTTRSLLKQPIWTYIFVPLIRLGNEVQTKTQTVCCDSFSKKVHLLLVLIKNNLLMWYSLLTTDQENDLGSKRQTKKTIWVQDSQRDDYIGFERVLHLTWQSIFYKIRLQISFLSGILCKLIWIFSKIMDEEALLRLDYYVYWKKQWDWFEPIERYCLESCTIDIWWNKNASQSIPIP